MSSPAAETQNYTPTFPIRIVTAASLFDGHDAAINIMRRVLQASGAEVIHLGHNRSVAEIVDCAIQEDAQAIAVTSYQGGHVEYFKYMFDLLQERGATQIKIFGGGGTILPTEIDELQAYGISRIYSPDDGREMGLQGMINDLLKQADFDPTPTKLNGQAKNIHKQNDQDVGKLISMAENRSEAKSELESQLTAVLSDKVIPVLGITGTGGAGKSSLVDELVRRYLLDFSDKTLAILSVDPTKRRTGGALLGDRIRMNAIHNPRVYMRSLATRQANTSLSKAVKEAILVCKAAGYDLIIVESSGIGQSDTEILTHSDLSLYVMTSEYGAATQLEKIDMIGEADLVVINKFDKRGSEDALRDVRKQYKREHQLFMAEDASLPVYGTMASQFNDPGVNVLYRQLMDQLVEKTSAELRSNFEITAGRSQKVYIIPPDRTRYLAEIAEEHQRYQEQVKAQAGIARQLYQLKGSIALLKERDQSEAAAGLAAIYDEVEPHLTHESRQLLQNWPHLIEQYSGDEFVYQVRGKEIRQPLTRTTLSQNKIPRVSLPKYTDWGDLLTWQLTENVPGSFPYTAGVFPLKRAGEDPTRMFAGEGGPERTNRRFHYVSEGLPAKRLSTAFDSVTLYGEDPDHRPDIYGKVGNSGVSIASLDDAKKLYSGFDLCSPSTSVSMTINGPAPMILAFFMNAAIDQLCEKYILAEGLEAEVEQKIDAIYADKGQPRPRYQGDLPSGNTGLGLMLLGVTGDQVLPNDVYQRLRAEAMSAVRGTVQADILKEDQAQNTCIFSTEFALRMMGDIQQSFIDNQVRNFYSVSISGYHIAEAGANPISQLAFTLANGFTFVEYYLSKGMDINDFAPNLSFFFSNGMDAEYAVIGRVARRIWAKAMRNKYGANERSQKLKYHIQTSGRSLHAQEIAFNDIRTTLQALYAIYDNCNSLHTNAYDEAITTPTEESVRRAMAIQLIINKELGLAMNENAMQGSFITEELTDLVEEAVMLEFKRISERGGVLGAMERQYQRHKIQEESMFYEHQKLSGELPLIGVNTYLDQAGSPTIIPSEVIRATPTEKEYAIDSLRAFQKRNQEMTAAALSHLQQVAVENGNLFEALLEAAKVCSLGQMSGALYQVGGQYRRNM